MKILNENIRELRISNGLSQVELAKTLRFSGSSDQMAVSGGNILKFSRAFRARKLQIADFFGVSTDYLLGRAPDNTVDISKLTSEQAAHIRLIIKDLVSVSK